MNASTQAVQQGFSRTCWRGIQFAHPTEWEPTVLSGPKDPGKCILVDRRYQRMQLHWEFLARLPDLETMYDRLRQSHREHPARRLTGAPGWVGLVRKDSRGEVVHAGRHFRDSGCLVQVVFAWPGRRDRGVEAAVLASVAVPGKVDPVLWEALGMKARVPAAFELASASHLVGRIEWQFRRPGRPAAGLTLERIALGRYWLKSSLSEWLSGQQPKGFHMVRDGPVNCAGHDGTEVASRRGGLLGVVVGKTEHQLSRAWRCSGQERIYRLTYRQRSAVDIDWPAGLEVHCCRAVRIVPGVP